MTINSVMWSSRVRLGLGLCLLVVGVIISRRAFQVWGADFAPQYVAAWMLREGKNVYDFDVQHDGFMRHVGEVTTWAFFYPPAAAVAALPATLLPYPICREVWFVVALAVMWVGLWRFMTVFVPKWDASTRVLVLGLVMCAASIRWGFKVAQPGSIVLGLFGVFLAELRGKRSWVSASCGLLVVSIKVTFGIPFFLMALAHRRWRMVAAMVAFWGLLNVIGLYGMGGPSIIADYRANFAQFERPDQLNYPDPRGFNSLARTDWPYLLNAFDPQLTRNQMLGNLLSLLCLGWLTLVVARDADRVVDDAATLALSGPIATLSMLVVYHHHYDMSLLLLPLIAYLATPELRARRLAWVFIVPVALYAGLYPYEKTQKLLEPFLGPNVVLLTKPLACAVCVVGFVASLVMLQELLRGRRAAALAAAPS